MDQTAVKDGSTGQSIINDLQRPSVHQTLSWPPPRQSIDATPNLGSKHAWLDGGTEGSLGNNNPDIIGAQTSANDLEQERERQVASRKEISLQCRSRSMPEVQSQMLPVNVSKAGRSRQGLQLPSFKSLGIANPHHDSLLTPPDEAGVDPLMAAVLDRSTPSTSRYSIVAAELSPAESPSPEDDDPKQSLPTPSLSNRNEPPPHIEFSRPPEDPEQREHPPSTSGSSTTESIGGPGWYDQTVETIMSLVQPNEPVSNVLNVLCHSQPCPLPTELEPKPSVYDPIINALQAKIGTGSGRAIEVTHAMPSKLNMQRIPTSPGNTPAPIDMVDYFSTNIFSKAVLAIDHETRISSCLPGSPMPVVPPSTVTMSILERYIPPASADEYRQLFRPEGSSALVDRLYEISPNGGCLIFIYPTLYGANSFRSRYLGPLLDPLLRSLVVYHNMSADLGQYVGRLEALEHMLSFENMDDEIRRLLRTLSHSSQVPGLSNANYQLVFSNRHTVQLDRKAWQDWWLYQENGRIRKAVTEYWKRGNRIPMGLTEGTIAREILDGVKERGYDRDQEPQDGVEVGLFCIRRTS